MSNDDSKGIQELFLAALERPVEQRDAWLVVQCGGDKELLSNVRALLEHDNPSDDPLERGLERGLLSNSGLIANDANGLHVRCPHCRNPIELVDEAHLDSLTCTSCGSSFSLIAAEETKSYTATRDERIAHFNIVDKVGTGAFGSVYRAFDETLSRTVAIKVPRKGQLNSEEAEKFFREARTAAQLRHPNIVSVHEVGRDDDRIYIVSDFIDGLTLTDWLTGMQPTPRESAELLIKVARALHHAHEQGVIHRDLKPGNIMLDRKNEPHLMDFGLAKREAGEITMTMDGQVLGTPAYMSPEQARGEGHHVDRRADIYALGVILFEMLTGERPFRGNTRMLLHQVLTEEAPSPRKLNASVSKDLETICLKCLEKSPDKRYAIADDLADDLQKHLEHKPITARPIGRFERGFRWCKRKPVVAGLAATLVIALTAGALISSYFAIEANQKAGELEVALDDVDEQKTLAEGNAEEAIRLKGVAEQNLALANERKALAESSERATRRLLYRSEMREAVEAKNQLMTGRVRDLLLHHIPEPGGEDDRDFVWYHLWDSIHQYEHLLLHGGAIVDMDVTRDDRYVATVSSEGICRVWERSTGAQVGRLNFRSAPGASVRFAPSGSHIAFASYATKTLQIWDWRNNKLALEIEDDLDSFLRMCWSPDGKTITCVASENRTIRQFDATSGKRIQSWSVPMIPDRNLVMSPDAKWLAATWGGGAGGSSKVLLLNLEKGSPQILQRPDGAWNDEYDGDLAFSPDSRWLASCGKGGFEIWSTSTGVLKAKNEAAGSYWQAVAFRPDGQTFFAASDHSLVECETNTCKVIKRFMPHVGRITELHVTSDQQLVSSGTDGIARLQKLGASKPESVFTGEVHALKVLGKSLVALGKDGRVQRMNRQTGVVKTLPVEVPKVTAASFSDDGQLLATGNSTGRISLWDLESGNLAKDFNVSIESATWRDGIAALDFGPDGHDLAVTTQGYQSFLIDVDSKRLEKTFSSSRAQTVKVSEDGQFIAVPHGKSAQSECGIELHSTQTGELLRKLHMSGGAILTIAFSGDSSRIASAGMEEVIRLSNLNQGDESTVVLRGHTSPVSCLEFSPDGKLLVSGDRSGMVRIWSLQEQDAIAVLPTRSSNVSYVGFSNDGTTLVIAGDQGVETLQSASPTQIADQVAIDQYLAQDDWPGLFDFLVSHRNQPWHRLSLVDVQHNATIEAIRSGNLEVAGEQLDREIELLEQLESEYSPADSEPYSDSERMFNTLLARAGIALKLGDAEEYKQFADRAMGLLDFSKPFAIDTFAWHEMAAFAEYRRRETSAAPVDLQNRVFLKYFVRPSWNVWLKTPADESLQVNFEHQIPNATFDVVAIGTPYPVPCFWFSKFDFEWLSRQQQFKHLNVAVYEEFGPTDEFWSNLNHLKNLETLSTWYWTGSSESEVKRVSNLKNLVRLQIDSRFTGFKYLEHLAVLENLNWLTFRGAWLSADDVKVFRKLPQIKNLELTNCNLDDQGLAVLAELKQLESLYVDHTSITAVGLRLFEGHPNLQRLDFFGVPVGDEIVDVLATIPNLKVAGLIDTGISRKAILRLRKLQPQCLVYHNDGYIRQETSEGSFHHFPALETLDEVVDGMMKVLVDSPESEQADQAYQILCAIAQEPEGKWAQLVAEKLRLLPSPFDQFHQADTIDSLPVVASDELPAELVGVLGSDRLNYVRSGIGRIRFDEASDKFRAVQQKSGFAYQFHNDTGRLEAVQVGAPNVFAASKDGTRALSINEGLVMIWDTATGETLGEFRRGRSTVFTFSPDNQKLFCGQRDGSIVIRVVDDPKQETEFRKADGTSIAVLKTDPSQNVLVVRNDKDAVLILRLNDGASLGEAEFERDEKRYWLDDLLTCSDRGRIVAVGRHGRKEAIVFVRDGNTGQLLWEFQPHMLANKGSQLRAIALSPDGSLLVTLDTHAHAIFWDVARKKMLGKLEHRMIGGGSLKFNSSGTKLVISDEHGFSVIDPRTRRVLMQPDVLGAVNSLRVSMNGQHVFGGAQGINRWKIPSGAIEQQFAKPFQSSAYAASTDGATAWGGGNFRDMDRLRLYDTNNGRMIRSVSFHEEGKRGRCCTNINGTMAAFAATGEPISIWDLSTGKKRIDIPVDGVVQSMALSTDGKKFAVGLGTDDPENKQLLVFGTETGNQLLKLEVKGIRSLREGRMAFNPDGTIIAFGHGDPQERRWQLRRVRIEDGEELKAFGGGPELLAHSPDGLLVAYTEFGGKLYVFDTSKDRRIHTIPLPSRLPAEHRNGFFGSSITFTPDSRHILIGNENGTVFIFRLELPQNQPIPKSLDAYADGKWISILPARGQMDYWAIWKPSEDKVKFVDGDFHADDAGGNYHGLQFGSVRVRDAIVRAKVKKEGESVELRLREFPNGWYAAKWKDIDQFTIRKQIRSAPEAPFKQIVLASINTGETYGETLDLAFSAIGNRLALYVNGKLALSANDMELANGKPGFQVHKAKTTFTGLAVQILDKPQPSIGPLMDAGQWAEAIALGEKRISEKPRDAYRWLQVAPAYVLAGDEDAFREFCRRMLQQFEGSTDEVEMERIIHGGLLLPGIIEAKDYPGDRLIKALAEKESMSGANTWSESSCAIFAYRAGDFEQAIEFARKSNSHNPKKPVIVMNESILAMAFHRQEKADESRQALESAAKAFEDCRKHYVNLGIRNPHPHDYWMPSIFYHEAKAVVGEAAHTRAASGK